MMGEKEKVLQHMDKEDVKVQDTIEWHLQKNSEHWSDKISCLCGFFLTMWQAVYIVASEDFEQSRHCFPSSVNVTGAALTFSPLSSDQYHIIFANNVPAITGPCHLE